MSIGQELRDIWAGKSPHADGEAEAELDAKTDDRGRAADVDRSDRFEVVNLAVDRRMLVNRQRKLKMYRCWMQGRFRKPQTDTSNS